MKASCVEQQQAGLPSWEHCVSAQDCGLEAQGDDSTATRHCAEEKEAQRLDPASARAGGTPRTTALPRQPQADLVRQEGPGDVGPGLQNLGNTCYVNATLQCLTHTAPLSRALMCQQHRPGCRCGEQEACCARCALQAHVSRALLPSPWPSQPREALRPPAALLRGFHRHRQEDAHEYLLHLLDALTQPCACAAGPAPPAGNSQDTRLVPSIFGGLWRSQLRCLHCSTVSDTFEPYLDVPLHIQAASSVEEALRQLVLPESLDGDNAYNCAHCGCRRAASKTLSLHTLPHVLLLTLRRFCPLTGAKDPRVLAYPPELDLRPYTAQPQGPPLLYRLGAVLVHQGWSPHAGHYLCYVQSAHGNWYHMDDSRVTPCHAASALGQQAYVLFYLRKNQLSGTPAPGVGPALGLPTAPGHPKPSPARSPSQPDHHFQLDPAAKPDQATTQPTPPITLDQWRAQEEHSRARSDLQLRKIPGALPAEAHIIHRARGPSAASEWHPSGQDEAGTRAASTATTAAHQLASTAHSAAPASASARATKRRKQRNKAPQILFTLHSTPALPAYRA